MPREVDGCNGIASRQRARGMSQGRTSPILGSLRSKGDQV